MAFRQARFLSLLFTTIHGAISVGKRRVGYFAVRRGRISAIRVISLFIRLSALGELL